MAVEGDAATTDRRSATSWTSTRLPPRMRISVLPGKLLSADRDNLPTNLLSPSTQWLLPATSLTAHGDAASLMLRFHSVQRPKHSWLGCIQIQREISQGSTGDTNTQSTL